MAKTRTPAEAPPRRGCIARLVRASVALGVLGGLASAVGGVGLGYLYYQYVIVDPGPHVDPAHVRSIIAQESPVYYRDGVTRIGVFFEDEHRQYVSYERLPLAYQMGIVAAEDGSFWSHFGVSPKHLVRMMRDNLLAGRIVAGGSTLTQQTAKNLYYRPDRSIRSKLTELVNALRLEAHFDKAQILTFYANQFHVSGNGRGLGIGSRYFFDKEPEELSVAEAAFMSGLVKAPSRYDPFLGDAERREGAVEKAHDRTSYVLRRITVEPLEHLVPPQREGESRTAYEERTLEAGRIRAEAQRLLDEGFELTFKRGTFRYDSNAVLDEVARRLGEAPFDEVLEKAGIEDPATAGLKVVTTLDPDAQRGAIYGLWHHLTEVGTWMEQLTVDDFKVKGRVRFDPDRPLEPHTFRNAEVASITAGKGKHLELDVGGQPCTVDRDGVVRAAVAVERGRVGKKYEKASTATVDAFVDGFAKGDRVFVSIREVRGDRTFCDLEVRPELQGAVIVLEDGEVRAMVGGNDNRNFNRTTALRQMGSTWKPLVFHAALELGWRPDDLLDNRRNVFPFSTTYYFPRPDHEPKDAVTMSWAGVNSENLASVWLLYHLVDKLEPQAFKALARTLDLARRPDESEKDYARRIQELGVLPTPSRRVESDFHRTRSALLQGGHLIHPEDALALQSMYYGWGFDGERDRVQRAGGRSRGTKLEALTNRWTHLRDRLATCQAQHLVLERAWKRGDLPPPAAVADLSVMRDDDGIAVACGLIPEGYGPVAETLGEEAPPSEPEQEGTEEGTEEPPAETEPEPAPEPKGFRFPWQKRDDDAGERRGPLSVLGLKKAAPEIARFADTLIDERIHASTLIELEAALKRDALTRQLAGDERPDLYDPENLYWHQDFRVLMGIRYLEQMARTYGVASEIQPVLSLPLGANEITLEEIASLYGGIVTGEVHTFPGTGVAAFAPVPTSTLLIAEIRDVDDNVLYRAEPSVERVAPVEAGEMTADILRNVVLYGTGRRAKTAVGEDDVPVPLGGKTGTTNDFKNAVFAGFAPRWVDGGITSSGGYSAAEGYAVAAYVGYDDNRPMKQGSIRLAGASGALPAWIDTVQGLQDAGLLGDVPDGTASVGGAWPMRTSGSLVRVPANDDGDVVVGAAWEAGTPGILVPLPTVSEAPVVEFEVSGRPVRIAPRTDDRRGPSIRDLWGRGGRRRDR
jgi:membrane peptidoglycan carboxypeptidase